ncbi:HrgA protein [Halobacteriovorax sp. RT-1-4]|uniref:HrgA protein n=1 Tax=unclassified Halobacteriovorax TaxID=2639665 RepID=UPI00399C08AE
MTIRLNDKVIEILKDNHPEKLTARELAEVVAKIYNDELKGKVNKSKNISNHQELINQLTREIGSRTPLIKKKNENVKTTEGRPRKYFYSELSENQELAALDKEKSKKSIPLEKDLYPLLSEYLHLQHNTSSKRINEKRSKNSRGKNGNKWLHPDIVGFEDLSTDWCEEIRKCSKSHYDKNVSMWSFEVKRLINSTNVREAFFQTVSNSSWANKSYLVAAEISEPALKELGILTSAHGIGFILLNLDNIAESQILLPCREKQDIDWDSCNKLAVENIEFKNYIKEIRKFYQTGESSKSFWDFSCSSLEDS